MKPVEQISRRGMATLAILALAALPAPAQSNRAYGELLKRIPGSANVLMLVDQDGLLNSKLGQREKWRDEVAARSTKGLGLLDDISRFVMASNYDLHSLHENWKLGVAEVHDVLPDLERIASREGGFVEKVQGTPVAWTPRGFSLLLFPPKTLGYVEQADRQAVKRWIETALANPRTFPPGYADKAFFRAEHGSPIVLVVNLEDAVSAKLAEPWLNTFPSVRKANLESAVLAGKLATARSAFLQIDVAESMQGTLHIEFDEPMDYALPVLKELILAVIDDYGAALPEMSSWSLRTDASKKQIELGGRIGTESTRRVLSLARPPQVDASPQSLAETTPEKKAEKPEGELSPDDVVKRSQIYFRSVADLLDGLRSEKGTTYRNVKVWYERYAKQIEELPILGVDSDLLDWGSKVAMTLREMSFGVNYAVHDQTYRLSQSPNGYYAGYYGYYGSSKSYDQATLKKQSDAVLSTQLDARWQALNSSVADMRRKMVEKYKVDF